MLDSTLIESSSADWTEHVAELVQTDLGLFDLSQDIGERNGLRIQRPEVCASLNQKFIDYFDNINAEDPSAKRTALSREVRQKIRGKRLKAREANRPFGDRNP